MNFSFEETPASGQETYDPPTYTMVFKAVGETDDLLVQQYALAVTPAFVVRPSGLLKRQDVRREPDGWGQYVVTVPYGKKEKATGSFAFSFDTTGATINIKAGQRHVATYDANGQASGDWHKGAIGVKGDGDCEGADIIVPALKLTYNFKHPDGVVNELYAKNLARATGRTNLNPFRSFAAGELLFAGGTGSDGTDAEAEVAHQFIASSNESSLSIGEISGIVKEGHHYAWVEFEDEVNAGEAVRRPLRVHVEETYQRIDFAGALGWS